MLLQDETYIAAPPERVFEFFEHMDEHYTAWHPDHRLFRWVKGQGVKPGVEFYFEEIIAGEYLKKRVRFTQVKPRRYMEFVPTWWLMRMFLPHLSFRMQPQNGGTLFTAQLVIKLPPISRYLHRKQFEAVRQHMHEEGQNLKQMLEQERR